MCNLRGAAGAPSLLPLSFRTYYAHATEFISGLIAARSAVWGKAPPPRGVQQLLDFALLYDPRLSAVLTYLANKRTQRESDVRQSFGKLYHNLAKGLHGVLDDIVVRESDFPAATERLALCALLEAYDVPYAYEDAGKNRCPSPYALSAAELMQVSRMMAAAEAKPL